MLHKLVRQLLRSGNMEARIPSLPKEVFERDRELLQEPFSFEGTKKTAVLFIHGWTSAPYEFRELGVFLNKQGYGVYAPLLSGHGTTPKDLKSVTLEDWLRDVDKAHRELSKKYDRIIVGGSSFGGTLSLLAAAKHSNICGLILFGTPYRLKSEWVLQIGARFFLMLNRKYQKKAYVKTWNALLDEHRCISYRWYPVRSGLEVLRGVVQSRKILKKLAMPAFMFQSKHDHVIDLSSIDDLERELASSSVTRFETEEKLHTFLLDEKLCNQLYPNILRFVHEVEKEEREEGVG